MRRLRSLVCIATDQPSINSGLSFIKRGSQYTLRTRSDSGSDIAYYGQCGQAVADRWLKSADSRGFEFSKSAHLCITVCWVYATMTMRRVEGRRGCRPCFRLLNVLLALQQCSFRGFAKTDNTPDARLSTTRMSKIADSSLQTSD